ncbi:F0F1 ATP synthase subunit delta [Fictibacillus macauensis ZFHKF-1]|uniref:ATP synthase subunit delta n=1 Tax=Fictibacillus macauensis ZFHKF-1 TaxID=1196324 RepID=I8UAI6_9BACL|nr:F0F1 ATP synthase subunit delta [Fictibacillus macauensis]EIT83823.1 F0F1 ATP synthase subunit delta [Fictibacillus macauensis ZFHKF-1]
MSKDVTVIAKRYATALYEVATEAELLAFEEELRVVKEVMMNNTELQKILTHPKISSAQKKQLVQDSMGTAISKPVLNTLFLLIDRNRSSLIAEMADQFIQLANDTRGVAEAVVTSVRLLSEDEKAKLAATFAQKVGKKQLRIENKIDPSLIGGIKIRIKNTIFDGSISGKLERMERQLATV